MIAITNHICVTRYATNLATLAAMEVAYFEGGDKYGGTVLTFSRCCYIEL